MNIVPSQHLLLAGVTRAAASPYECKVRQYDLSLLAVVQRSAPVLSQG